LHVDGTPEPSGGDVPRPGQRAREQPTERGPDAVRRYLDALGQLQESEREVLGIVRTIQRAAKDLEHWQVVHVAHAGAGFPKEVTMAGRTIDGSTWPTGRQLADALAAWHGAAEDARAAWAHLPEDARSAMPAPP
jgi:hypothetical protein